MATGVKPRDEESQLSRADLETIQDAMKCKKFREMLSEYCQEITDPANQALYQQEMTQLEKERGYDVTFINPKGGYVIKTSVAGDRKAFINICSNENVGKPSYKIQMVNGQRGMNWHVPYSLIPPREDYDHKKVRVVIYDVVFHPDTLRMAEANKCFREIVNKTAFDGLNKAYDIHLDANNLRFPKSNYKGMMTPAVIRKEDPNYVPPTEEEGDEMTPEIIEKLYPQHIYSEKSSKLSEANIEPEQQKKKNKKFKEDYSLATENGYTIPKYVVKQQKNIDFQDFTYHKDCKQHTAIPSHIVVEIYLPLLSSTKDCILDVKERTLYLKTDKPAKYKLTVNFPYSVNDEFGSAKFDQSKHMLIVTLPVNRKTYSSENKNSSKVDSGVESEENSQSDEDNKKEDLIVELSSSTQEPPLTSAEIIQEDSKHIFLEPNLGYILPPHTHNVMDDIVAFTFHVKNTEPDSVKVHHEDNQIKIKFTSIGSGFVPIHYAAVLIFDENVKFLSVSGEAWDNNVILQLEVDGDLPNKYHIGLNKENMSCEYMDVSQVKKNKVEPEIILNENYDVSPPMVEVTNLGNQTEITVTTNNTDEYDYDDNESPMSLNEKEPVWTEIGSYETGAKSILRKSRKMSRSYSESSVGDIASSMDYVSSDCIPEESSFKKTVRFNDVIAKQFYRYNSSIEGQKKKNQRKKNKKRNQERHRSESEAEDDASNGIMISNANKKTAIKPRRDSGLADTSDAECEFKMEMDDDVILNTFDGLSLNSAHNIIENVAGTTGSSENVNASSKSKNNNLNEKIMNSVLNITDENDAKDKPIIWKSGSNESKECKQPQSENNKPFTSKNIKHNTDFYNPDKLNKGLYLEVSFKNDLIFDLDM